MDEVNISQLWLNDAVSLDADPVWRVNRQRMKLRDEFTPSILSDAGGVHVFIH